MPRSFVPFEALWKMAIDVPYSFLVRDRDMAWSCGQLAMDKNSNVVGPNDIAKQTQVVCEYVEEILDRGGLSVGSLTKLLLYYVNTGEDDRQTMIRLFRDRFGNDVLLVPICVPHYYYDGVLLEVDVFCEDHVQRHLSQSSNGITFEAISTDDHFWVSVETAVQNAELVQPELRSFLARNDTNPSDAISEHWFAPNTSIEKFVCELNAAGSNLDGGAVISSGSGGDKIIGHIVLAKRDAVHSEITVNDATKLCLLVRQSTTTTWIQARSMDRRLDLVGQTEAIMKGVASRIGCMGLSFNDVVKSTTHYVGESSASALHNNMQVRNAYYKKPGPASTGLPVFGFSDAKSLIVLDLTLRS